jgi:hypothetical protein
VACLILRTDYSPYDNCTGTQWNTAGHPGMLHTCAEPIFGTVLKQALSFWCQPEAKNIASCEDMELHT